MRSIEETRGVVAACGLAIMAACTVPQAPARQMIEAELPPEGIFAGATPGGVALLEFGSFSCPICYEFSENILPRIDSVYLRPKRITYRYVEVAPVESISAAATALASCAAPVVGFPSALRLVYGAHGAQSFTDVASAVGRQTGQAESELHQCVRERLASPELIAEQEAARRLGIPGTPTFIVGRLSPTGRIVGWAFIGGIPYDTLAYYIELAEDLTT